MPVEVAFQQFHGPLGPTVARKWVIVRSSEQLPLQSLVGRNDNASEAREVHPVAVEEVVGGDVFPREGFILSVRRFDFGQCLFVTVDGTRSGVCELVPRKT